MSYILDALRKADAERERDPSRGIHAQPAPGPAHAPPRGAPWGWMAAGGAGVLLVAGAYLAWKPSPAPVPRALPSAPAAGFVLEAPRKPPVVTIADAVVPAAPPPLPAPVAERAPAQAAAVAASKTAPAAPAAVPAAAPVAATPSEPPAAATQPTPAAPERIVAVSDLPADVQRELPKLAISGGVHSENAAQRMLLVGGQVKAEGAELAPGVVLEQIRARSAVLRFKGFRYSVPY